MASDLLPVETLPESARSGRIARTAGPAPVDGCTAPGASCGAGATRGAVGSRGAGQGGDPVGGAVEVSSVGAGLCGERTNVWAVACDYLELTKPRIVVMILITTIASAVIAAGGAIAADTMLWLLAGTGLVAASAGAANQVWEREIDRKMSRTAVRPLPDRRLGIWAASSYTLMLGVAGTWVLADRFGLAPATVGVATWLLYVAVYTPMKIRTAWNTSVGAVAGALPMLIGFTAMGGSLSEPAAWLLVAVLVAWQFPHFMAIAWIYRRQYGEAGFRMTTTEDPSGRWAAVQSVAGSVGLMLCGVWLCWMRDGVLAASLASTVVLAACFPMLRASIGFTIAPSDRSARSMLRSSLLVLPAVLAAVTLRAFW